MIYDDKKWLNVNVIYILNVDNLVLKINYWVTSVHPTTQIENNIVFGNPLEKILLFWVWGLTELNL